MSDSKEKQSFIERYMTPIAVLLGAVIIAFALMFNSGAERLPSGGNEEIPQVAVDIKNVKTEGQPYIGSATAPATLAVWFDYQCAYCKRFDQTTLKELKETYVANGQLKIVLKDFQFFPGSEEVGVFGRAMWEAHPDQYAAWLEGMFALPGGETGITLEDAQEVAAGIPGVDALRVRALAEEKREQYLAAVQADRDEGSSFGVRGTPSSIVGTSFIDGARDMGYVEPLIRKALGQ